MFRFLFLIFFVFLNVSIVGETCNAKSLDGPYKAEIIEIIDGDTFRARIQIWLGQEIITLIRLNGVDTPEMRSSCPIEKAKALRAKNKLTELLTGKTVTLYNIKQGKYAGRVIADVSLSENIANLSEHLINETDFARLYHGKKRVSWC